MTLHEQIKSELKKTMLEKNQVKLGVIRGLITALTNEAMVKGHKPDQFLTDEETLAVIRRLAKQRKDSIVQFKDGGRDDLATSEQAELVYIESYLPKMMERSEVELAVKKIINKTGATKSDVGKIIGTVMKELKGQADGTEVKAIVEELLG